jgi:transposase
MANRKLTDGVVAARMVELRNLRKLHAHDRQQIAVRKSENRQLKAQMADMAGRFEALFQKQQIRIAELEKMVFGARPTVLPPPASGSGQGGAGASGTAPPKQPREPASFRRSTPKPEDATATTDHAVCSCASCGSPLTRVRNHVRYVEDIVLPVLDPAASAKTVTKQHVQSGWCVSCQTTTYGDGIDLRGSQVVLGDNIRLLTMYFMTVLDMTYSQVVAAFRDLYGVTVSEGELAAMAAKQGKALLKEHETIARGIREGPGKHLDETSYKIFSQAMGWAWVAGSTVNEDVIYHLAESRGKDHVKALFGINATSAPGVHIHDCYAAYKRLDASGPGQTCWSHYYRVVRDLAALDAETLGGEAVQEAKTELGTIYTDLRHYLAEPFDQEQRQQQQAALQARIDWFCVPHQDDPEKLRKLKARMQAWRHTLLTCLTTPGIPADNNKAERHIRKLVLETQEKLWCPQPQDCQDLICPHVSGTHLRQPHQTAARKAATRTRCARAGVGLVSCYTGRPQSRIRHPQKSTLEFLL